jgi:two-component system chemotaxis sensor kinase CheA
LGESVLIQIMDDGRGVDRPAVADRARRLGLNVPEEVDDRALLEILSSSGFSTRDEADRAAGRGVGMAVVANTVRELGGTVTLETELGHGTTFKLRLPLTLSISDAIIVSIGDEICAVPQGLVDEVVQIPAGEARGIKQTEVVPYRDGLLPLVRLRSLFGLGPSSREIMTILVVSSERGATGVVVDGVRARREVVVRPLADPLVRVAGITGATELGDGRPILILDPGALTSGVVRPLHSSHKGASLLSS